MSYTGLPEPDTAAWDAIRAFWARQDAIAALFAAHRAERRAWWRRYLGDWNA